jgi:hypothetical protein
MKYGLTALIIGFATISSVYAKPIAKDVLVDLTGQSEEVIETLKEEKTYHEIAEDYGVSEEFYAQVKAAKIAKVEEKFEEGQITEEQRDDFLTRINNGETKIQMRIGKGQTKTCDCN